MYYPVMIGDIISFLNLLFESFSPLLILSFSLMLATGVMMAIKKILLK